MLALIQAGILDIFVGPDPIVSFSHSQHQFKIIGGAIKSNLPRYVDILIDFFRNLVFSFEARRITKPGAEFI